MKFSLGRRAMLAWISAVVPSAFAQRGSGIGGSGDLQRTAGPDQDDVRLPNGKLQKDELLKAEHEQNLKDAGQLIDLAEQLKQDLEKNDRYVLSLATLKKTDDIEKLVKKIRSRLRRS
jgi:hypothetical protein